MPPTGSSSERDLQVLVTGYGPFAQFVDNPSWLAIVKLHNTHLDLPDTPTSSTKPRRVHIQVLQSAVVYAHVLSLVPLIHGNEPGPDAQPWFDPRGAPVSSDDGTGWQGSGAPYPAHYRLTHPKSGYDAVIHVGVGAKGGVCIESTAHKRGYQMADAKGDFAPVATDQSIVETGLVGWLKRLAQGQAFEQARLAEAASKGEQPQGSTAAAPAPARAIDSKAIRGFARGYEAYADELQTGIDTVALVAWLKERGVQHVKESNDPGRFLCDFIFYASLAESLRANSAAPKPVLFIHVPPLDQPYKSDEARVIIRDAVWWIASRIG